MLYSPRSNSQFSSRSESKPKNLKEAILKTIADIPEGKFKFYKGQIILTIDGGTIIPDIKECLPIKKFNLKI